MREGCYVIVITLNTTFNQNFWRQIVCLTFPSYKSICIINHKYDINHQCSALISPFIGDTFDHFNTILISRETPKRSANEFQEIQRKFCKLALAFIFLFAYLTLKNSSVARFARAIFIFTHFTDVRRSRPFHGVK